MSKTKVIEVFERTQMIMQIGTDTKDRVTTVAVSADDLKELNSDYINEHYGSLQDEAYQKGYDKGYADKTNNDEVGKELAKDVYQRGLDDGWEAARKIFVSTTDGGYSMGQIREILGKRSLFCATDVIRQFTINEVIEKLKAYEEKQKAEDDIKVGDEVRAEDGTAVFVVTWMSENCICGVDREGKCYSYEPREVCGKTGRRCDISFSDIARGEDNED